MALDGEDHVAGPPTAALREHAGFRARESPSGIGAAVVSSSFKQGVHRWDCIVTDGQEWHYVWVLGPGVGPFPNIAPEDIEGGIERFAAKLPAPARIRHLLDADPLHLDQRGVVGD
ncbi:MAG TPA: hypothetical protein VG295_06885 [Solirubrobacteraceae bacterium]|nr:hypothetical protein [Solirubrobacteraceae bacterium]